MPDPKAIDLIEDLIQAVETLQGLCGWEPPEGTDHAEWVGCEVVANAAKFYIQAQTVDPAAKNHPCDKCGEMVPEDEYLGHDQQEPPFETEYLCSDCYDHPTND